MNGFKPFMIYICNTMKLYMVDMDITTMDIAKIQKKIQTKYNTIIVKRIYSDKGIIEIDKSGKIWSMEIIDEKPSIYTLDNQIRLYIDKSTFKRKDEVFQISPEHISVVMKKMICSLSPNAMVQLVIETVEELITDIYFETEIDIQQHSVREDIVTFLALLNFIECI